MNPSKRAIEKMIRNGILRRGKNIEKRLFGLSLAKMKNEEEIIEKIQRKIISRKND